jgi:hypothetical protein
MSRTVSAEVLITVIKRLTLLGVDWRPHDQR